MRYEDKEDFSRWIDDLAEACKGNKQPGPNTKRVYFNALKDLDITDVANGIDLMVEQYSGYFPQPIEIRDYVKRARNARNRIKLSGAALDTIALSKLRPAEAKARYIRLCRLWLDTGHHEIDDDKISEIWAATNKLDSAEFAYFIGKNLTKWPTWKYANDFKDTLVPMPIDCMRKISALQVFFDRKPQDPRTTWEHVLNQAQRLNATAAYQQNNRPRVGGKD